MRTRGYLRLALGTVKWRLSYGHEVQSRLADELDRLVRRAGRPLRILDVGCGRTSMLEEFDARPSRRGCHLVGLDAHGPTIDWCRIHGFHDEYVCCDARDTARLPEVDVVVATDLVEHLEKDVAVGLIGQFERNARRAVLLFTPNGYVHNPFGPENPYMEHKCGFSVAEFTAFGYDCVGFGGPKAMRGEGSVPRGPKPVTWPLLAALSRLMRGLPGQSFHIMARKVTAGPAYPG